MNDIFGIPMHGAMMALLLVLACCLLSVGWVAIRQPVIFKLGMRNMPRRKHQSTVVVLGLMLSTLTIAAALGTGDTLDNSVTGDVYDSLGSIDEMVVASQDPSGDIDLVSEGVFPIAAFNALEAATADDPDIDGVMPQLDARAAVVNTTSHQAEPDVIISGVDPGRVETFGGLTSTDGAPIDLRAIAPNEVVVSASLAQDLDASVGDSLTIHYHSVGTSWTIAAIAEDSYLSGTRRSDASGLETSGLAMPLASLQDLTGQPDMISAIAVSNTGDSHSGKARTGTVVSRLQQSLTGRGLGVDPIKQDRVKAAEDIAALFTSIFLVLGLFSISAGVLLIVLIFTMLAAERRPEMGMERAVGTQRRQLVQQFVAEGSGYAILAGLIGSALGILAALGIAWGMGAIFGDYVSIEPHFTLQSVAVAYSAGVAITFFTVIMASLKVSRLNIVAAVRDIPDATTHHRNVRSLVWGTLTLLAGSLLTMMGLSSAQEFAFMTGMSLMPFGLARILGFFGAPGRPVYNLLGIALLVFWMLPDNAFSAIFGDYDGGVEMYFVSGIMLVVATTILVVENLDLLLSGLGRLSGVFRSLMPAMRTAIAYPSATKGRTGMTIAMFSLIVFSLVMMATMNTNYAEGISGDEANAGWHVRADLVSDQRIEDFTGALETHGVDTSGFEAVAVTRRPTSAPAEVRVTGAGDATWKLYPVIGMDPAFIDTSTLRFNQRAEGYDSDAAVIEALRTEPDVVVVDAYAVPAGDDIGGDEHALLLTGLENEDKVFEPITLDLLAPDDGSTHQVRVIGVIDSKISSLQGLYGAQATIDGIYHHTAATSYYVALDDPERATDTAREIESALLSRGVAGISIREDVRAAQAQENGFLYIIEGFLALGLVVGIAAVGVISFRSVVERRQQIGVMRALGFQRQMVAASFLIETIFVVGLGGLTGTLLGLVLARNLIISDDSGISDPTFIVPWGILLVIVLLTNVAALVMTWVPALQAGRIAPAEALRYE